MKKKALLLAIVLCIVVVILVLFYARTRKKPVVIRTTGIVEGTEVNLSPKVGGRISYICCNEGDSVTAGERVIELESEDLKASVREATAGVEKAGNEVKVSESVIENTRASVKSAEADTETAQSDVEKARVHMELSRKELDRADALYHDGLISKDSHDVSVAAYDASAADYTAAKSRLDSTHSRKDAAEAQLNTAENRLESVKLDLRQAEAALAYAQAKLADTVITSPISGVVVFKSLEKGEMVSPGVTILTIVDMGDLYVRADVDETLVGRIPLNGDAIVRTEGNPGREFAGKVSEIGRYAEFATEKDVTRGRQDIRTFRVKIRVNDTEGTLKPGMTVEVEIPQKQ